MPKRNNYKSNDDQTINNVLEQSAYEMWHSHKMAASNNACIHISESSFGGALGQEVGNKLPLTTVEWQVCHNAVAPHLSPHHDQSAIGSARSAHNTQVHHPCLHLSVPPDCRECCFNEFDNVNGREDDRTSSTALKLDGGGRRGGGRGNFSQSWEQSLPVAIHLAYSKTQGSNRQILRVSSCTPLSDFSSELSQFKLSQLRTGRRKRAVSVLKT